MSQVLAGGIWDRALCRSLAQLVTCAAAGVLAGIMWVSFSPRAQYHIGEDLHATMSERAYAEVVGSDATFVIVTGIAGVLIGLLTWVWFSKRDLLLVVLTVLGAALMTLTAWQAGELIGGTGLIERIALAKVGDYVQTDLVLRSYAGLAAGPFCAITPVMLLAAFMPERSVDEPEAVTGDG